MDNRVSDTGVGILCFAAVAAGAWLLLYSFRTGESPTIWPMADSTRAGNPTLFWFDVVTYTSMLIAGFAVGLKLLVT
jgi:hypothetical protein